MNHYVHSTNNTVGPHLHEMVANEGLVLAIDRDSQYSEWPVRRATHQRDARVVLGLAAVEYVTCPLLEGFGVLAIIL